MVKHTKRPLLERTRRRPGDEQGSLILDILIGMAIFALIAIIAVSAVGQYRMRAYIQAAVSDATQLANALANHITDATSSSDWDGGSVIPVGDMDRDTLALFRVNSTPGSVFRVLPSEKEESPEDYSICVEHKGAYAVYDTGLGGLQESGSIERDNFQGCAPVPADGEVCLPERQEIKPPAYEAGYDEEYIPGIEDVPGIENGQFYFPHQIPGMTKERWLDPAAPWHTWGPSWKWWLDDTSGMTFDGWGLAPDLETVIDSAGNPMDGAEGWVLDASGNRVEADVAVECAPPIDEGCYIHSEVREVWVEARDAVYSETPELVTWDEGNIYGSTPWLVDIGWAPVLTEAEFRATYYDWWWTDVSGAKEFDSDYDGSVDTTREVTAADFMNNYGHGPDDSNPIVGLWGPWAEGSQWNQFYAPKVLEPGVAESGFVEETFYFDEPEYIAVTDPRWVQACNSE